MKRIIVLFLVLTLSYTLIGWPSDIAKAANTISDDEGSSRNSSKMSNIILKGDSITLDGDGAIVDGSRITIKSAGIYSISGTLDDGQIIVNTNDKETVNLVLNGADITCSTNAPIYVLNGKNTVITLADGTENHITDGESYVFKNAKSDEPNAAIFSRDDLTINGNGSLTVDANFNNGIQSKDQLKITGGNISVNAINDGIKGRDSIEIKGGNISVNAGGDGMQSNNDVDPEKGYISIEGGTINIISGGDGIQAETNLMISGGNITISSGGEISSRNMGRSSLSIKGIKAGVDLTINGGIIDIDSIDDSIHSNNSLKINGGEITLACRNDGIGSTSTIEINGGDINILNSYEGIESSVITINDGNIHLISRDDGINGVGYSGSNSLNINGGYIVVDAYGDGLDINGSISMTGGVVIISGPLNSMNGPLDYYWGFNITGGFIVASGSSGMAQVAGGGSSSTQNSVMVWFYSWQQAGTMFHIESEDGEEILTLAPKKAYSSVTVCSPELKDGLKYNVFCGGSSTGTVTDGLYSGGTYTSGTLISSFTISNIVTYARGSYESESS